MARTKPCPLCGKTAVNAEHAPFCSQGCRDRDLLKWLGEGYTVPVALSEDEEDRQTGLDTVRNPD